MSLKKQNEDLSWSNKWRNKLIASKNRRFFINSGEKATLRHFTYEQTYLVLEYFLPDKKSLSLSKQRFMEIGCGSGTTSINILKNHPGVRMFLVDNSFDAIRVAKQNLSEENLKAFLVVADTSRLPFKDNSFSTVFSIGLLEHIPDPSPIVIEQSRVIETKGSWMALVVPTKFSVDNFISPFFSFLRKCINKEDKLLRSFWKTLTLSFGLRKPTPFRNEFLDNYYKKILNENLNMDDIKSVYLNPFCTSVKIAKANKILLYIYIYIVKFRKVFLSSKFPFSSFKCIAYSFFITARKK